MNKFPEELHFSAEYKRNVVDNTRLLLALRGPHTQKAINDQLQGTEFVLEGINDYTKSNEPRLATERINHTDNRFWVHSSNDKPIDDDRFNALKEKFREELDWIGPVYRQSKEKGDRGCFCPLPTVLLIRPALTFKDTNNEFSQRLAEYGMKEVTEKSKYLGLYRYYTITNTENEYAYQIKDRLKNNKQFVDEILFEIMPMISPISLIPNDILYHAHPGGPGLPPTRGQWNMEQIEAGGSVNALMSGTTQQSGTTAWDISTGDRDVVIAVIDSQGCDIGHTDLQLVNNGANMATPGNGDGSPVGPINEAHGTACAGIAAARINNHNNGVVGVAPDCRILPIVIPNSSSAEIADAIRFASNNGARVISMSFFLISRVRNYR